MDEELAGASNLPHLHPGLTIDTQGAARSRAQSFSQPRISTSPTSFTPISSPGGFAGVPSTLNKARKELRKLLAHLLSRLKDRPQAPSVFEGLKPDSAKLVPHTLGVVLQSVKTAVRIKGTREFSNGSSTDWTGEEDDIAENEQDFSTDVPYDYMVQLRDVLIMSDRQGWQILHPSDAEAAIGSQRESSSRRLRRTSPQRGERFSSPSFSGSLGSADLLLECIDILATVISEDCRFKVSSPRLFRPPHGLQAVCLDVAQILVKTHRHDPKILSLIAFAVIPAFASFDPCLHTRLLAFFEDGILRGMLEELQLSRGIDMSSSGDYTLGDATPPKTPIVAIQVDGAVDHSQWSPPPMLTVSTVLSAVAPSQSLSVYQLSSLIPPLLGAILEAIDPFERNAKDVAKIHRFHTLLRTIIAMKWDAYLDVLEVIAYHGAPTRSNALALLATFWPKALGHVTIGKPPQIMRYDSLTTHERDHLYAHEFIPWRFHSPTNSSSMDHGVLRVCCQLCSGHIKDFGLMCPFCFVCVHMNCYDPQDGTFHGQYSPPSEVDPWPYTISFSYVSVPRKDVGPDIIKKGEHDFRSTNVFTLTLCLVCQKPLWGYAMQGMKCVTCHQFVHSSCIAAQSADFPLCHETAIGSHHVVIDWSVLRQTFIDHYQHIIIPGEDLVKKTYEEISIFYSILWAQLQILENGVIHKSIVVKPRYAKVTLAKGSHVDTFELHNLVQLYEGYLSSGKLVMSPALREYHDFNKGATSYAHSMMFDWSLLANLTSIIKTPSSPHITSPSAPSNLLQVADHDVSQLPDVAAHSYEVTTLSQIRDVLKHEFYIQSDHAAGYILSHLRQIGFVDTPDTIPSEDLCSFPLPLGLDLSTSVETLVVAIEACLKDIDIAVNEYGFLLLVRRFAPTGAASEYALTRLTKIVLSWILAEDDRLIILARDHIAHNLNLPGVRTASDPYSWPSASAGRYTTKTAVNSGGEYVSCRKQLLTRHVLPWLASVHDLDVALYTSCLFDQCMDVASESHRIASSLDVDGMGSEPQTESMAACGELMLRLVIKLAQTNALFSTFEQILIRWFDYVTAPEIPLKFLAFRSLTRLFNRDPDQSRRTSTLNDVGLPTTDSIYLDPWKVFVNVANQGTGGLQRSLSWLRVMAQSTVDIPIQILKQLFDLARDRRASLTSMVLLLESTMTSAWLKTFRNEGLDTLMVQTNAIWVDELLVRMRRKDGDEEILNFLRYSLVICLLVFGCERQTITSLGLIDAEFLRYVSQRRRSIVRNSAAPAILKIDQQLVTIVSRYVMEGSESVCAVVAKFLNTLVSESTLLESHEVDQFILLNGDALTQCAWRFYDIDLPEISHIRTSFLLRLLVVDYQPLDVLIRSFLRSTERWQTRHQAVTRLFLILLDINSPSFGVQDRQWKTSVTHIINNFFEPLWMDDREEIRFAVETWARTLLPAHLRAISSCWDEYMSKAPVADRAKLASFLVQLHPHFPSWQVLSWETIVETLLDDGLVQNEGGAEVGLEATPISAHSKSIGDQKPSLQEDDSAIVALRVSLVILSLQLIADRVEIDLINLSKVKFIIVKFLGFTTTRLTPVANGQLLVQFDGLLELHEISYPCINPLMRVLDASHTSSLSPSLMGITSLESTMSGLVGDAFVDIVLKLWDNIADAHGLHYSVLRGLLESMILIIEKHELSSPSLKHLDEIMCRAVKNVTDAILQDSSYDIRHLCLGVMLSFMRGYPVLALKILGHQVQVLTRLSAALQFNTEDTLVSEAREFLETAFFQYEVSGLFWLLSKQGRMSDDLFVMIRHVVNSASSKTSSQSESLRDSIVRDTLSKVAASTNDRAIPDVLHNLERYVTLCHHQSFPVELIQHIGLRLTAIARQTADFTVHSSGRATSGFDPNPLLLMSATIVQYNKLHSADLLLHTETLLRASLARFDVSSDTIKRLLRVTSTIYRRSKAADVNGTEIPANHLAMGVLDVLSDSLKGKVRPLPSTMAAMLKVVLSIHGDDEDSYLPTSAVLRMGMDAVAYLSYPVYREAYGQTEFAVSLGVAELILRAIAQPDSFVYQSLFGDLRNPPNVRVWNLLILAGLESPNTDTAQSLLALLPKFVVAYVSSLRGPLSGVLNETAAPSVNHAFASIKLWILLARKAAVQTEKDRVEGSQCPDSDGTERMIWNELWPPFERLLAQSLPNGQNEETPPLLTFVRGCIADLMLFVRQARSVIALDTYSHMSILNKLRMSAHGEVAVGKQYARAQNGIIELPAEVSFETLKRQVSGDVSTAEKLQAVEVYRQGGFDRRREYMEKGRPATRELWTVT